MNVRDILKNNIKEPDYDFVLPWPPSVNEYHQPAKVNGKLRIIKSSKVRSYLDKSVIIAYRQMLGNLKIKEKVVMQIDLYPPTSRSYDVDNRNKAILDTLSKVDFWVDDDQCESLLINKCEKSPGGEVRVFIWVI